MANHDFVLENNPGRAVRTDFNNALAALASNNSGTVEPAVLYPGMLWLDLSVLPDGLMRQRNLSNTGWITMSGVPEAAVLADLTAGTDDTKYVSPAVLDQSLDLSTSLIARNLLVNPAMQISQELGDTASTAASAYPADQWVAFLSASGAAGSIQRLGTVTPRGSPQRIHIQVTTAKASLATTDNLGIMQLLEGVRCASLMWGTAAAKPVVVRFGFRGPAGTYACSLRNGAATRSYIRSFTISAGQANTDTEIVLVFPGDTLVSATNWPTDNSRWGYFTVAFGIGATYQNSVGSWLAGNFFGAAGMSNGAAVVNNDFHLFDAGLYEDVSGVGTPPRWFFPDVKDAYQECLRYYASITTIFSGWVITGNGYYTQAYGFPTDMRSSPTFSIANNALATLFPSSAGGYVSNPGGALKDGRYVRENRTANASSSGTTAGFFQSYGLIANARL